MTKSTGVNLRVLSFAGHSYEGALRGFAEEFETQSGVHVDIHSLPDPLGWWHMAAIAQADCVSKSPRYDIFCDDREWQFQFLSGLLPLNPYLERSRHDKSGFLGVTRYDEGLGGVPGVRYGLPLRVRVPCVYYRSDLVPAIPADWKDYEHLLGDLTAAGRYGLGVEGGAYPFHPFGLMHDLTKLFLVRYWSLGDPLLTPDWEPLIGSERGVHALEMLKRHIQAYAPPDVLTWDGARATRAFLSGEVPVFESVGAEVLRNAQNPEKSKIVDRWNAGAFPGGGAAPFTLHNLLIFRHCPHPQAAFDFIAHCTGPGSARRLHLDYGEQPARRDVLLSPEAVARDHSLKARVAALELARPSTVPAAQCYEMLFALWEALQLCLHGHLNAAESMDVAARRWRSLLRQEMPQWEYRE